MEYGGDYSDSSPAAAAPTIKQRLHSSICFSCCFRGGGEEEGRPARLIRSSSEWILSKAQELPSEIKERLRSAVSSSSSSRTTGARRFRYDPLDYALNFDEGGVDSDSDGGSDPGDEEFRRKDFASRLPISPPTLTAMEEVD